MIFRLGRQNNQGNPKIKRIKIHFDMGIERGSGLKSAEELYQEAMAQVDELATPREEARVDAPSEAEMLKYLLRLKQSGNPSYLKTSSGQWQQGRLGEVARVAKPAAGSPSASEYLVEFRVKDPDFGEMVEKVPLDTFYTAQLEHERESKQEYKSAAE